MENTNHDWLDNPKAFKKCPKCHRNDLDTRIPRTLLTKIFLFWMPYKRYRCGHCGAEVNVLDSN